MTLAIEPRHLAIIQEILAKYPYTFATFGSRGRGDARRLSDLDLCFFEAIPLNVQEHILEDFEESNLPYKVDLVDWNRASAAFREMIRPDLTMIQHGKCPLPGTL